MAKSHFFQLPQRQVGGPLRPTYLPCSYLPASPVAGGDSKGGCGPVAELVGIEGGVVSGVFNLESSDVGASDRRPRHEELYHEV
jgi:hypothetical protein